MATKMDKILKEFDELKGQFVINNAWDIERFVAVATDGTDYFYVTYNGRKLTWYSSVGRITQLKNKIDDKDYQQLIKIAKLNHFDQPTLYSAREKGRKNEVLKYNKEHIKEITKIYKPENKYITDFCWEIN